jgi:hypothetical protein
MRVDASAAFSWAGGSELVLEAQLDSMGGAALTVLVFAGSVEVLNADPHIRSAGSQIRFAVKQFADSYVLPGKVSVKLQFASL